MADKSKVMAHLGKDKQGAKKKEPKHHTHRLTIERADRGGHILHHETRDEDGNPGPPHTSVAMDNDDMQAQAGEAMADQPPAGEGAPPQPPPPEQQPDPTQGQ
jgi:hypothetical protein